MSPRRRKSVRPDGTSSARFRTTEEREVRLTTVATLVWRKTMGSRTTVALCLFIAVLAGLTTHASGEVRLTIREVTSIRPTHDGRYFARASLQVLANGVWVMTYVHSDHHWKSPGGQIEVMFSGDEGRTWAPPNTYLDGKPVSGLPSAASPKESPHDPVEPYIYLAPNGDLVIAAMDAIFPSWPGRPPSGPRWYLDHRLVGRWPNLEQVEQGYVSGCPRWRYR